MWPPVGRNRWPLTLKVGKFEQLHADLIAAQAPDPGDRSVAEPAPKSAERLPGCQPETFEESIASDPPSKAPPPTATALTAAAPPPADGAPDRAMAD